MKVFSPGDHWFWSSVRWLLVVLCGCGVLVVLVVVLDILVVVPGVSVMVVSCSYGGSRWFLMLWWWF